MVPEQKLEQEEKIELFLSKWNRILFGFIVYYLLVYIYIYSKVGELDFKNVN